MLEKPKFLTGEVKEFIDEFAKYWHNTKLDYKQISFYLFETSNFYNQPFNPAKIKEFFKNVEWDGVNRAIFTGIINNEYDILISEISGFTIIERTEDGIGNELSNTPIPQTLNHFISDCKRAGIGLEWRE